MSTALCGLAFNGMGKQMIAASHAVFLFPRWDSTSSMSRQDF